MIATHTSVRVFESCTNCSRLFTTSWSALVDRASRQLSDAAGAVRLVNLQTVRLQNERNALAWVNTHGQTSASRTAIAHVQYKRLRVHAQEITRVQCCEATGKRNTTIGRTDTCTPR